MGFALESSENAQSQCQFKWFKFSWLNSFFSLLSFYSNRKFLFLYCSVNKKEGKVGGVGHMKGKKGEEKLTTEEWKIIHIEKVVLMKNRNSVTVMPLSVDKFFQTGCNKCFFAAKGNIILVFVLLDLNLKNCSGNLYFLHLLSTPYYCDRKDAALHWQYLLIYFCS